MTTTTPQNGPSQVEYGTDLIFTCLTYQEFPMPTFGVDTAKNGPSKVRSISSLDIVYTQPMISIPACTGVSPGPSGVPREDGLIC